ncbi:ATP synthase F1 subunit delta [Echinicola sp. CAU 1574]|uniref:ATP synthase subunit delta n=1 Tax=Echinicola arenosa TaxID=2774144 RepID=A0ABR9AHT6_9BACT|nr:ATP synthase F1 subunit delta [Echinicola arenosa]MBD8488317.1 ATP synthase F1 subunit delta [Echinicola arenosa]
MSVTRVASRYAKSLLELAVEKGILKEVHQDMQQLLSVVASNRDFALLLKSPIVKSDVKAKVVKEVFSKSAQELTLTFFDIISRKNREDILTDIAKEFHGQYNIHQDIQVAELTTTFEINDDLRKAFEAAVKEISGRSKVELVEKIDKDIIGGFVLKVNDRQLDESMSSKLKALRLEFSSNHYEKRF